MNLLNYKEIIPGKYIIPSDLLKEYTDFMSEKMPVKKTGRPRSDSEKLIAGIYYLLKTGCQWDALPLCFGPAKTVYHRFRELVAANAFQKIWKMVLSKYDQTHGLMLNHQSFDSCHKKAPLGGEKTGKSPVDRRKIGTKINLATEGNGLPIAVTIERGNNHDTQLFKALIEDLPNQIHQSKNHFLHTDKGYASAKNRLLAVSYNYTPFMPEKKKRNGSPPVNQKDKNRWVVERTFSWITRFRRLSIRYEKLKTTFLCLTQFAFQIIIFNKI